MHGPESLTPRQTTSPRNQSVVQDHSAYAAQLRADVR